MKRARRAFLTSAMIAALLTSYAGFCGAVSADSLFDPGGVRQAIDSSMKSQVDVQPAVDSSPVLHGGVGAFGVLSDEVQRRMGLLVGQNSANQVGVTDILPGSAAFDCGIHKGDRILDAHIQNNALNVTIARNGSIFRAHLREIVPKLIAETPKRDNTPTKPFTLGAQQFSMYDNKLVPEKASADLNKPLNAGVNQFALQASQNYKRLANYNVELIVDRSMSMRQVDCPGGLSRWNWCGLQAAELARSLSPYSPNGLTIVPFATEYDVFEHANAQQIDYMFNNVQNQSGTRLFEPLAERLDTYFAHRTPSTKPLLVVVVTDGVPVPKIEPQLVRNELITSSLKMTSPGEVTVIFCQIGGRDRQGIEYLLDLDQNLVAEGAKYHYVHTISFDELSEAGLGAAVAASINQYAPQVVPPLVVPRKSKPTPTKSQSVRRA